MDKDEMKRALELEVIAKLIDEVEIDILEKKEQLLALGKKFTKIVATEESSGSMKFKDDTMKSMDDVKTQYSDLIQVISKQVKFHHFIIKNNEKICDYLNGWLRTENYEVVGINKYIEGSFSRKELDKEK